MLFFKFPPEILELASNLRTLDLSGNKLIEVSSKIGGFSVLKHLTLSRNRLGKFSVNILSTFSFNRHLSFRNDSTWIGTPRQIGYPST